jgi:hypothetical protein
VLSGDSETPKIVGIKAIVILILQMIMMKEFLM